MGCELWSKDQVGHMQSPAFKPFSRLCRCRLLDRFITEGEELLQWQCRDTAVKSMEGLPAKQNNCAFSFQKKNLSHSVTMNGYSYCYETCSLVGFCNVTPLKWCDIPCERKAHTLIPIPPVYEIIKQKIFYERWLPWHPGRNPIHIMLQSGSTCCSDGTLTSLSSKTLGWSSLFPLASTLNGEYDLTSSLNS